MRVCELFETLKQDHPLPTGGGGRGASYACCSSRPRIWRRWATGTDAGAASSWASTGSGACCTQVNEKGMSMSLLWNTIYVVNQHDQRHAHTHDTHTTNDTTRHAARVPGRCRGPRGRRTARPAAAGARSPFAGSWAAPCVRTPIKHRRPSAKSNMCERPLAGPSPPGGHLGAVEYLAEVPGVSTGMSISMRVSSEEIW
jgi:hypothetical protein